MHRLWFLHVGNLQNTHLCNWITHFGGECNAMSTLHSVWLWKIYIIGLHTERLQHRLLELWLVRLWQVQDERLRRRIAHFCGKRNAMHDLPNVWHRTVHIFGVYCRWLQHRLCELWLVRLWQVQDERLRRRIAHFCGKRNAMHDLDGLFGKRNVRGKRGY